MQARAAQDFQDLVVKGLAAAGLTHGTAQSFATPRRLALVVAGLPERSPDQTVERKGPRADAPPAAIEGFLRSTGLDRSQLEERDMGKAGRVLFAVQQVKGRSATEVAVDVLQSAILALPWPKSMRWADNSFRWVRPLQRILAIIDGKPLPLRLPLAEEGRALIAGNETEGHRFLAPGTVKVSGFDDYVAKLRKAYVVLDAAERKQIILQEAQLAARSCQADLRRDDGLLDEVSGLVEWPVPLVGSIDGAFMDLPPEVLTTTMRTHQRYFALESKDGALAPRFLVVANMAARDGGKEIVKGNERVLRARLADAKFFWDLDRKATLESRLPALKDIVFQAKLGTLNQRVERLERLAVVLAQWIPGANNDWVRRAARLAKADLKSGIVGEFPELQGVMGRYYALHDGEQREVADAIAEHYGPKGPEDRCHKAPTSVAVALAEKLDTLVGFWAIGEKPTGSKDPFALRRAALGIIRLVVENNIRLPLAKAFDAAAALYPDAVRAAWGSAVRADLLSFFADRLKVHLKERGVRHDLIAAVFSLTADDDLVRLLARVDALQRFLADEDGADLLTAYKRAANIVRIEEKNDGAVYRGDPAAALFQQEQERALGAGLSDARRAVAPALAKEDFGAAMGALARLRAPVDAFFDDVTVNADDPALRRNRLLLLSQITATLEQVADFSKIEG